MIRNFFFLMLIMSFLVSCQNKEADITGELKKWHKITFTFNGPETSELDEPNPFLDYRLNVIFTQGNRSYTVPGYYAADGQAGYTSASSGNKWRVHFSPDAGGEWNYRVSFRKGNNIAISGEEGEGAAYMDGTTGSFEVQETDKTGRDLRAHGRLQYVGEHYQKFAETGEYFLKCGADAPENFLAYYEIDNTPDVGGRLKKWEPHAEDYNKDADAFLWGENKDKGKNILGAINYLSGKGMNVFSFLTFNIDGDDKNVFPYLLKKDLDSYEKAATESEEPTMWEQMVVHDRFDVSKLDQWEQIFSYGEMKGMFLHFKTMERENDQKMDQGKLGKERKLYYRQLIARFGHHLALNWNLSEEISLPTEVQKQMAAYFADHDPYNHLIVLHTIPRELDQVYRPLAGNNSKLTGVSVQTNKPDFSNVHKQVKKLVSMSDSAGKKWVVAVDEPGDASHALVTDEEDPEHNNARINGLWGTFMAGGAGTEWYFGYKHPHSDLTAESWRSRDLFWNQCKVALDFFTTYDIPVQEMQSMDELTEDENDYVFAKPGEIYLIYRKTGGSVKFDRQDRRYEGLWYNPRTGESKKIEVLTDDQSVFQTPTDQDWLLYLYRK